MEGLKCEICNKFFTGIECFMQHEASEKHKKKKNATLQGSTNTTEMKSDVIYHCSVCSVSVSGRINHEKHVNSLNHASMIQSKSRVTSESAEKICNARIMPNSIISVNNSIVIVPYAECKFCKKQFTGPEPYQQHLASAAHKKKAALHSIQKDELMDDKLLCDSEYAKSAECSFSGAPPLSARQEICNTTSSSETQLNYKCVVCNISLNGPETYQQHLRGKYHKKKIKEMKSKGIDPPLHDSTPQNSNPDPRYYCGPCKRQNSGPVPFYLHISSKRHKKNVQIAEMESGIWPGSQSITSNSSLNIGDSIDNIKGISQMNVTRLIQDIAVPIDHIVTPENMGVKIFGVNEEIVFDVKNKEKE
ncbi:zinc finger protein [Trichonephila inaurata madagascariensis]|uniref:Zinc finger protein n=1 Tax=Trichonephila inaurata madagascariensis TaxID=2747483 RepID=A0A8X6YWH6_9ARAC|nr:zinc finger protein [Trichonephila inaurata madagascariensis]